MKKIVLLSAKWILFIIASALASLIVYETINVTPGVQTSSLKISFMLLAWIGWGAISVYNSKQESLEGFSKSHQALHHIVYFFLLMAAFGATLTFVFLSYKTIFPSPVLLIPPSSLTPASALPPTAVPSEGLGTPHVFTPDMWQPQAYKSDDFNGAIAYDPNYDPEKDELLQFMNALQDKIYNSETHDGKEGGSFALSMGKEDVEWQTDSKQPKQTLSGRFFGIRGPDNAERERAKNYFKDNGFVPNSLNSTTEVSAYTKGKFVCLYQDKNLTYIDLQFKCAMIE